MTRLAESWDNIGTIAANEDSKRDRVLSFDEDKALLVHASPELRNLIIRALDTGTRQGEMLSITIEDLDVRPGCIRLRGSTTQSAKDSVRADFINTTAWRGNGWTPQDWRSRPAPPSSATALASDEKGLVQPGRVRPTEATRSTKGGTGVPGPDWRTM